MTIPDIKKRLSILQVLTHYGIELGKNNMIPCPFHADEKPSMKIYPETNTVFCFAGNCEVQNLDVIDFIMTMDKSRKHEAIEKAKKLIGDVSPEKRVLTKQAGAPGPEQINLNLLTQFAAYRKSLKSHKDAQSYCNQRALEWEKLEIGYKGRTTSEKWGRGCIIFPLRNPKNEIVSLYGRGITGSSHFYQSNRQGLYPCYPSAQTKRLILTESVIDAASLEQLDEVTKDYTILALYGTNGLTSEQLKAIEKLPSLEEIIFFLDGDEGGQKAVQTHAQTLKGILPDVRLMNILPLENEDVNSILVAHLPSVLPDMIARRRPLNNTKLSSTKVESNDIEKTEIVKPKPLSRKLNTDNPHNLIYTTPTAKYYVKGGVRCGVKDLDSLKITLVAENKERRKSRNRLDLYEDKQVKKVGRIIAEKLALRYDAVELDIQLLTDELEEIRERNRLRTLENDKSTKVILPLERQQKCRDFLKLPNLLKRINELIGQAGVVGESNNRLLLFVVASSYKMPHTLHALIQGASGSGKTRLLKIISQMMPEEDVKKYTRVTDGGFYNQPEHFFVNKLLCLEDMDGLKEEAQLAARELISNEILITATSIKDENGAIQGGERIVRGPVASLACTTKADIYEDNISRCFVVAVDESKAQSLRVIEYQNKVHAGIIDRDKEPQIKAFLRDCMRMLKPCQVINPYAHKIHLPEDAHKIRRLNELYQNFVQQITILNQYQRKTDAKGRLITEKTDLQMACNILFESIVLKVDELDGSLRQFFEKLKKHAKSKSKTHQNYEFDRFEIRQATGVSKTQQHRYMKALVQMEYLHQRGFANRGYQYKIAHWDNMTALRNRLKSDLQNQLNSL